MKIFIVVGKDTCSYLSVKAAWESIKAGTKDIKY